MCCTCTTLLPGAALGQSCGYKQTHGALQTLRALGIGGGSQPSAPPTLLQGSSQPWAQGTAQHHWGCSERGCPKPYGVHQVPALPRAHAHSIAPGRRETLQLNHSSLKLRLPARIYLQNNQNLAGGFLPQNKGFRDTCCSRGFFFVFNSDQNLTQHQFSCKILGGDVR